MNITLLDLNHMTMGVHTNTVPLGIGLIAEYLKKNVKGDFDIKLFKNHKKLKSVLNKWTPDVVGITQYSWNSQLNLYMANIIKKKNPECMIVAGGPNLFLTKDEKFQFLKELNFIDVCVGYDGEIPFSEIIKHFQSGESIEDIRSSPVAGSYSIDSKSKKFVESDKPPPRLKSLDVFGPIYSNGIFDQFFEDGHHPFLQTQRGCPFRCAYCHASDNYCSSVIFQSPEIFTKEMEYLGQKFEGQHNVPLYLANTNFGLFKKDFEIAKIIRRIQDKYEWPKTIDSTYGKDPDKLLKLFSIWKYKMIPIISLQTFTPNVLKNINRMNISYEDFSAFQNTVLNTISKKTSTELILNLPGETKESFLKTISLVLNSGVQNVVTYTLMSLKGTPLASKETKEEYGHVIRHRIVPRCFSEIDGAKIFDTEEVVVGTNEMSYNDYLFLRGLSLIITTFASSAELFPIRKFLMEKDLDVSQWIFSIQDKISEYPSLHSTYNGFLQETENELFNSKEELEEFFNDDKNYNLLLEGKLGDNLLRKYKTIMLSQHFNECLDLGLSKLKTFLENQFGSDTFESLLKDFELYLRTRDVGYIFDLGYNEKMLKSVNLKHDIPAWLDGKKKNATLKDYVGAYSYEIMITDYMRKRLSSFKERNQDPTLSKQIFYRDGYIEDFWPEWKSI